MRAPEPEPLAVHSCRMATRFKSWRGRSSRRGPVLLATGFLALATLATAFGRAEPEATAPVAALDRVAERNEEAAAAAAAQMKLKSEASARAADARIAADIGGPTR